MDSRIAEFLETHRQAVLATNRRQGGPQLSRVLAAYYRDHLWISITEDRAKYKNILRDPNVSLLIGGDHWYQYVVVYGVATLTHMPDAREALREYYERGAGQPHPNWEEYDEAMARDRRVLASIEIQRTVEFGLSRE